RHAGDGTVDSGDAGLRHRHEIHVRAAKVVAPRGVARLDVVGALDRRFAVAAPRPAADAAQHLHVGARTEAATRAGDHDADDLRIAFGLTNRVPQLDTHLP